MANTRSYPYILPDVSGEDWRRYVTLRESARREWMVIADAPPNSTTVRPSSLTIQYPFESKRIESKWARSITRADRKLQYVPRSRPFSVV